MEQPWFIPQTENHFLALEKPIVFFDLETTGTSTTTDRIVELCAIRLNPDGSREELHHLINPTIPIPPGATSVHGIIDDMVANKPTFEQLADELAVFFQGADLGGYNIRKFDVPLLMEEFHRFRIYPIQFSEVKIVDAMGIYHSREKRDLSAAVRFYLQREHDSAHSAKADVLATIDIRYEDLEPNTTFLHDYLHSGNNVDINGRFVRDASGEILFNFGKHQGKPARTEPDYLQWMIKGDFAIDTKMVASRVYKNWKWEREISEWLGCHKILQNKAMASALYTSVKFEKDVFPFATARQEGRLTVTYVTEPPSSYTLQHADAEGILLKALEECINE
jgi:DNA polymerase III subunit epsilon